MLHERKRKRKESQAQTTGFELRLPSENFLLLPTCQEEQWLPTAQCTNPVGTTVVLKLTHWTLTLKICVVTEICVKSSHFQYLNPSSPILPSLALQAVTTTVIRCFLLCLDYTQYCRDLVLVHAWCNPVSTQTQTLVSFPGKWRTKWQALNTTVSSRSLNSVNPSQQ